MNGEAAVTQRSVGAHGKRLLPTGKEVLGTIGLWMLLSATLGTLAWFGGSLDSAWRDAQVPVTLTVAVVYASLPLSALVVLGGWTGVRQKLRLTRTTGKTVAMGLLLGLFVWICLAGFITLTGLATGSVTDEWLTFLKHSTDYGRLSTANAAALLFIGVRVCFLAGVTEEFLFRGLLFGWLRRRYSAVATIAVAAIPFVLAHLVGTTSIVAILLSIPGPFLWAILAGWLRERSDSIVPLIAGHIMVDIAITAEAIWCLAAHVGS